KPDGVYLLTVIDSIGYGKLWKAAMATLRQTFGHVALLTFYQFPDKVAEPGRWHDYAENRQVYVIYAADHPLDPAAMAEAAGRQPALRDLLEAGPAPAPVTLRTRQI